MISAYWLKDYREEHAKPYKHPRPKVVQICLDKFEAGFQVICRMYDELMVFAFQHPWKIVLISVASLIFNLFLLPLLVRNISRHTIPVNFPSVLKLLPVQVSSE